MIEKDELSAENLSRDELRLLGARICMRRTILGLHQRDLVNDIYYERLINDVENGLVAPSNEFLAYLAAALATTPPSFFEDAPAEPASPGNLPDPKAVEQELALMNAHTKVEIEKPEVALSFLAPFNANPDELASELRPVFFRLRGNAHLQMKNYRLAEADLREALRLFESQPSRNPLQTEVVRNLLGLSLYRGGRTKEALKVHQDCLEAVLKNNITNRRFRLILYTNLANEHYMLGKSELAIKIYKNDALPLAEQGEDDIQVGLIYWGLGITYKGMRDYAHAVLYFDRSAKLFQKAHAMDKAVQMLDQLGLALADRGDLKLAEETLLRALGEVSKLNDPRTEALINNNLAHLYKEKGEPERALGHIENSVEINRALGDALQVGQSLATLAEVKLALGKPEEAFKDYEEATRWLDPKNQSYLYDKVLENYAEALKKHGFLEKALEIRFNMSRST
jgi:tetratricopeptide (TPR) repeat protein